MAGAGYKQWVDGDVLTAGDVNTYLMDQAVMVFDDSTARGTAVAAPTEGMVSYLKDTNAIEKYDGSSWVSISPTNVGKVLQVVYARTNTDTTIGTTSMTDTTLTATITPSAATSKILVICGLNMRIYRDIAGMGAALQLVRDATTVHSIDGTGNQAAAQLNAAVASAYTQMVTNPHFSYLDSPSTTSATTYKVQARPSTTANGGLLFVQWQNGYSSMTLIEIGA